MVAPFLAGRSPLSCCEVVQVLARIVNEGEGRARSFSVAFTADGESLGTSEGPCGMCTAICPQNIEYVDYVLEQRAMALQEAKT